MHPEQMSIGQKGTVKQSGCRADIGKKCEKTKEGLSLSGSLTYPYPLNLSSRYDVEILDERIGKSMWVNQMQINEVARLTSGWGNNNGKLLRKISDFKYLTTNGKVLTFYGEWWGREVVLVDPSIFTSRPSAFMKLGGLFRFIKGRICA